MFHYLLVLYTIYPFSKYNTYLAICTYASWYMNDYYCIISQIEYKYFNTTSYFKNPKRISTKEKNVLFTSQFIKLYYNIYSNINMFE